MGGIFGKKIRKSVDSKDQIRLCFHEKKRKTTKNYVDVKTPFAHVIASLFPAASKPLIMKSFWCLR